jgi:hypothetical protein
MGDGCGALIATGPLRAHCDVLFLLGLRPCDERCADEVLRRLSLVSRIEQFMREGGGVFASARPGSLLARLCEALPRLRHMGGWSDEAITPGKGDAQHRQKSRPAKRRLALACTQPARLYLDFRSPAGGVGHPHPLLQSPPPLHWLDVPFDTAGGDILPPPLDVNTGGAEWPLDAAGQSVSVEVVALCAGGRSGPVSRSPLPALAPAILAYDGERVGMGRIAVDENIDHVLQAPVDSDRSMRLDAYHANLASWLLPRDCRLQARVPRLLMELRRYPLYEELAAVPWPEATPENLLHVSEQVMASVRTRLPAWEAQALIDDTLDEAAGDEAWLRFDHAPGIGLAPAIESL